MRRFELAVIALGLLAACPNRPISKVIPVQNGGDLKDIPVSADVDILFVVDNSSSTTDKQTVFSSNFSNFVTALDAFPTGRPNLHIGVVNTTVDLGTSEVSGQSVATSCPHPDPADNGKLQAPSTCGVTGSFISDVADPSGGRTTNYGSDLATALGCIADVGASGCGFEAPLNAMERALNGSVTANAGFIRTGAYLAVVFLTDEDDASIKDGSAGDAVFALSEASAGGLSDFRIQPLYAYQCDQPLTAGSGSATYTNCKPRTDLYLEDPLSYSQFLSTVKDPARTVVAVIAGPPPQDINGNQFLTNDMTPQSAGNANGTGVAVFGGDGKSIATGNLQIAGGEPPQDPALLPSCAFTDNGGQTALGRPGVRLAEFEQQFENHGRYYTICQDDYSDALTDIGTTLFNAISPCLEGAVDTTDISTSNPGPQLDCQVTAVLNLGGSDETSTTLPVCQMSAVNAPITPTSGGQCYWIEQNDPGCTGSGDSGYSINFEPPMAAATGTTMQVECATISQ